MCLESNRASVTTYLNSKQQTRWFSFQNPMHFLILLCYASLCCWKDSSIMPLSSVITALFMTPTQKTGLLLILLSLEKAKHVTQNKIRWIMWLFYFGVNSLSQELPDADGVLNRGFVVVTQSQFVLPQLSSLLAHRAKHTPQNLLRFLFHIVLITLRKIFIQLLSL